MNSKGFHDDNGNPLLEPSICVFMDVLGFSSTQKESIEPEILQENLTRFHSVIKQKIDSLNERKEYSIWEMKIFTDNIVLGSSFQHIRHESIVMHLALDIADYQWAMAKDGYFVRGGLAMGHLFMDEYLGHAEQSAFFSQGG